MSISPKEQAAARFAARTSQPYQPTMPSTGNLQTDHVVRIAHALEYIAAQLGQINSKLDAIVADYPKPRTKA